MIVGIMQPYFMPYLGYFQLINSVDRFILFDDVQYIRHGWINRNKILKPVEGWQYISVPLQKYKQKNLIRDISIKSGIEWKDKIMRQMEHYKKKAPFYKETITLLEECLGTNEINITHFNAHCLRKLCHQLEIPFQVEVSSEMNFDYSDVNDSGEWALRICEQVGATKYLNPIGGKDLFDISKFEKANIELSFLKPTLEEYDQKRKTFEPGLSILDAMMFTGIENTKRMINAIEK